MTLRPRRREYRVKPGDNLWNIAQSEYGDATVWPAVASANSIPHGNLILIGMDLELPAALRSHRRHSGANGSMPIRPQAIHSSPAGPVHPRDFAEAPKAQVLGPQRPGSVPIHHDTPQDRLSLLNMPPAKAVTFPALNFNLLDVKIIPLITPTAEIRVSFTGEITVQMVGLMESVEISTSGDLTEKLKAEYDSKIIRIADEVKVKPSPDLHTADVSCGFTLATKQNGREFVNQTLQFTPPNKYKCSIKPTDIAGEIGGLAFAGTMGVEVEITVRDPRRSTAPVSAWITVGTLATLGAAVIVADIIKDAGSVGILTPTSPIAWSVAMALFGQAAAAAP
jgi:hypothetical protein